MAARTVELTAEQAEVIDQLVAEGTYPSASAVIAEALDRVAGPSDEELGPAPELTEEDVERWLKEEVAPTIAEYDADPSNVLTADEVREHLARLHAEYVLARGKP